MIKDALSFSVEYVSTEGIQNLRSAIMNNSSTSFQTKRPRFLSEDNCYPSFQVQTFQTLILQNDYLTIDKPKAETSRHPETQSFKIKDKIIDLNHVKNVFKKSDERERESTSRKSTEFKSYFKSRNIDISIDELSGGSFDLKIDEDLINEEEINDQLENKPQPEFNIDNIISKVEKLKSMLS